MVRARLLSAALLQTIGCTAEVALPSDPDSLDSHAQAVIGGTAAQPCQWPSTVRIEGGCTGTLIHSRVVTTAAHCLARTNVAVSFGEVGAPGTFSVQARCVAGARGAGGANSARDWAYCVLPDDPRIDAIPTTPPLVGCEAKLIGAGSKAWVVGYGATSPRGNVTSKRQVEVNVNARDKAGPGTLDVGDRTAGACHGDSGGPLYVHLRKDGKDYGVRVAGSTSGAGSAFLCDCTCSTVYVAIENHVRAIEKNEGIDVTPCTDAEGNWAPGPLCRDLPSAPESGTGTYPAACVVAKTTGPIESCGSADGYDGGAGDAGPVGDAAIAVADAATPDAGSPDASTAVSDASTVDAGRPRRDAGLPDAAQPSDGGRKDAGSRAPDDDEADEGTYAENDSGCSTSRPHPSSALAWLLAALVRRRRA